MPCAAQCKEKPKGDKYGFTYFARMMNEGKGVGPLASDSRRRPDRAALEVRLPLGLLPRFASVSCLLHPGSTFLIAAC